VQKSGRDGSDPAAPFFGDLRINAMLELILKSN